MAWHIPRKSLKGPSICEEFKDKVQGAEGDINIEWIEGSYSLPG